MLLKNDRPRVNRRQFLRVGLGSALGVGLGLGVPGQARASLWVPRQGIWDILSNPVNYAAFNSKASYLLWDPAGKKLDQLIRDLKGTSDWPYNKAEEFKLTGKASGTRIPDGQCVALVRGCTTIGATKDWKRGANVLKPGAGQTVPTGAAIARFDWSASQNRWVYGSGHTGFFLGYRTAASGGGIAILDQNWFGELITWHSLPLTSIAGVSNPEEYYLVER
jgi:hypothetical protein